VSDPIAEVRTLDSQDGSVGAIDRYRAIPKDASGAFESGRKLFGIKSPTQKLISFVVIGLKPEQFLPHLLRRHFSHTPAPFEGKTAFSGGDTTSLVFRH
jgi:hypothetical protein